MARHCDQQPGDKESVEKNPVYLLSPVLRDCLRDKAREVKRMHDRIKGRIVVDNLGDSLNF